MKDGLPTLKGLRAFEVAYRLRSFTSAANALNVQQPAISYQIKMLESDLGVVLFDKKSRRPKPTAQAHELYETLSKSFDAIRSTSNHIRGASLEAGLTIATYPGIGTYWLSNRFPFLCEALGLNAKLVTLKRDADLWNETADCRIAFGRGDWPGRDARRLIREEICPVAAPELASKILDGSLRIGSESAKIITQEDPENRWLGWRNWFEKHDSRSDHPRKQIVVNDHGLAMHMTLAGSGVALAWLGVMDDLLSGGSLVRLSDKTLETESGYWLVGDPGYFETNPGKIVLETLMPGNTGS